jgi:hypothetical protein
MEQSRLKNNSIMKNNENDKEENVDNSHIFLYWN